MAAHAKGTFAVGSWDEDTYAELDDGGKLSRAKVSFTFTGDLEAEGTWDALMFYKQDGTAIFTGFQRTTGTVAGRSGSFVLRADGGFENGEATTTWEVIPGTATGELSGLAGGGSAVSDSPPGGSFTLDYDLA